MDDSVKQTHQGTDNTYFTGNLLIGLGIVAFLYLLWKEARTEAIRRKINAPGPRPWPLVGNLLEARKFNGYHLLLRHYYQKYGKVFCLSLGRQPTVVIADPEILRKILVKDFANFQNHFVQVKLGNALGKSVFFARDQAWRRIRATLSPTFSAKKMKGMMPLMEESIDRLMERVANVAGTGKSVDISEWFSRVTLEVILSTAFGVQVEIQNDEESLLVRKAKEAFRLPWIVDVLRRFPIGAHLLILLNKISRFHGFFEKIAADMVQQRRKAGRTGRRDLMDLMLAAHEESTEEGVSKLTDEEIVGQCVIFLLAGYETSSNTLGYIAYQLALNQYVQDKLRQEIKRAVDLSPNSTLYDIAHSIEYLDCVINEALRLHPPLAHLHRECAEDYECNGVCIPAGSEVVIPVYSIHRDPDVWPDPETFDPERFLSPSKDSRSPSYRFMPFGFGPRSCIGMRFALMEIKIALAKFLTKYKIVRSPETQVPLKILSGGTLYAVDGIFVRMEPL